MLILKRLDAFDSKLEKFLSNQKTIIFNLPVWNKILEESYNTKVWYYSLMDDNEILLTMPGLLFDYKIIKIFHCNMPYGSYVGDRNYLDKFLLLVEEDLKKKNIHQISLTKTYYNENLDLKDYKKEEGLQHVIDLEGLSLDNFFDNLQSEIRRNIKRAIDSGIEIENIRERRDLEYLYKLYLLTMKRNRGFPIWPKKIFYQIYDKLLIINKASILLAKLKNKIIAGLILIHSDDIVFYLLGGSDERYFNFRPNDLLFLSAIKKAITERKRYFDFGATPLNNKGLIRFKEKWNAQRYPFIIYKKDFNKCTIFLINFFWKLINTSVGSHFTYFLQLPKLKI